MTDSQKSLLYRLILLTIIVSAVYGATLGHRFVWDDLDVIVKNRLLDSFTNLPKLFLYEDRTGDGFTGYYRPVTYISFLIDRSIWGLNPVGFNLTNLILQLSVVLLFYKLVAVLFKKENLAFVAALIFALHPVAVETVNFHAGGRNTLLSACFSLLALLLYINKKQAAAVVCFTLAIFSKEFALLLPVVFFLYDGNIRGEKRRWSTYLPYLAAIAGYLTLRSFAVANGNLLKTIRLSDNLLLVPKIIVSYLMNMAFPANLKVMYDLPADIDTYSVLIYSVALTAVAGAAILFRKKKEIAAAACCFFLFLLPVIGLVPLGSALMADRYAYFSLMGFSLALACVICMANRRVIAAATLILCVSYAAIDVQRNAIWKDMPSLYTQMTIDAPAKSIGFTNLGMFYYEKGDLTKAERYLEQSCAKKGIVIRDAYQYLSAVYWEGGKFEKALSVLNKLMTLEPRNPQSYIMASRIYESMGNKAMARKYYDKVTTMYPNIEEMISSRTEVLCREGEKLMAESRGAEAERKYREALMMKPTFVPALIDMGSLEAERRNLTRSVAYFTRAVALEPVNPSARYNLSMAYELMGRSAEAGAEMKKFKELEGSAQTARQPAASQKWRMPEGTAGK